MKTLYFVLIMNKLFFVLPVLFFLYKFALAYLREDADMAFVL